MQVSLVCVCVCEHVLCMFKFGFNLYCLLEKEPVTLSVYVKIRFSVSSLLNAPNEDFVIDCIGYLPIDSRHCQSRMCFLLYDVVSGKNTLLSHNVSCSFRVIVN